MKSLAAAQTVIAFSPYRNGAREYADAIVPITPSFETSGTFVNTEGRVQTFNGSVRPLGDARPQRDDALFLELEDGAEIHLRGVDEVAHVQHSTPFIGPPTPRAPGSSSP